MFGDYSKDLLRSGIIEFKAGNREAARRYLDRTVYMSGDHEVMAEAWYWLSQTTDDAEEKRQALENCLANDLQHARARRARALLDGDLKADEIIDPNRLGASPREPRPGETLRLMCPRCGGRMTYSPDGASLVCEYCQRHQAIRDDTSEPGSEDFIVAMATRRGHGRPLREGVFHCQGCGAEFILAARQLSGACPYCSSPHVVSLKESRDLIEPDGILPHLFTGTQAASFLGDWVEGLRTRPDAKPKDPGGIYLPVWSFVLGGGIDYAAVERVDGQSYGRRLPATTDVHDRHPVMWSISIAASRRPSGPFVRLLPSFDMGAVVPYDARYLADWPAELYDVPMVEASLEARSQAYAQLKQDLARRIYPSRLTSTSSANLTIDSFRLDLVPVWITEISVEDRTRIVLINGQNGRVQGEGFRRKESSSPGLLAWLSDVLHS